MTVLAVAKSGLRKVAGYRLYGLDGVKKVASGEWFDAEDAEGREFLREATQVKNIWVPYGE